MEPQFFPPFPEQFLCSSPFNPIHSHVQQDGGKKRGRDCNPCCAVPLPFFPPSSYRAVDDFTPYYYFCLWVVASSEKICYMWKNINNAVVRSGGHFPPPLFSSVEREYVCARRGKYQLQLPREEDERTKKEKGISEIIKKKIGENKEGGPGPSTHQGHFSAWGKKKFHML